MPSSPISASASLAMTLPHNHTHHFQPSRALWATSTPTT
ncbi:hypothetical protein LINPERHAP1_LOCUS14846 [Linum perenne]